MAGAETASPSRELPHRSADAESGVVNGLQDGVTLRLVAVGLTIIWVPDWRCQLRNGEFGCWDVFGPFWLSVTCGLDPWSRS